MTKIKIKFVNNIRQLRFENNEMSQLDLAEKVGCSRQTIIAIEQGNNPSLALAFRIACVFEKKIEEAFQYNGDSTK